MSIYSDFSDGVIACLTKAVNPWPLSTLDPAAKHFDAGLTYLLSGLVELQAAIPALANNPILAEFDYRNDRLPEELADVDVPSFHARALILAEGYCRDILWAVNGIKQPKNGGLPLRMPKRDIFSQAISSKEILRNWPLVRQALSNTVPIPQTTLRKMVAQLKHERIHTERAAIQVTQTSEIPRKQPTGMHKKATIASRMIDLIRDPATHAWTAEQFRVKLGCKSRSTVTDTPAWKKLIVARESARLQKAERAYEKNLDRRRLPKRKHRPHSLGD